LITVENKNVHSSYKGKPINYNTDDLFLQTQDISPVNIFVYSVMVWKASSFIKEYEKNGAAMFSGKFGTYSVSKESGLIVKTADDLILIDQIIRGRKGSTSIKYYK